MLVGLLTGHISLQYMLHKMRKAKTPSCRRCGAEKESFVMMDPEQIKEVKLSGIVAFGKGAGLLNSSYEFK